MFEEHRFTAIHNLEELEGVVQKLLASLRNHEAPQKSDLMAFHEATGEVNISLVAYTILKSIKAR